MKTDLSKIYINLLKYNNHLKQQIISSAFKIRLSNQQMLRFLPYLWMNFGISMNFSICLGKKNAEAVEFSGILKNFFSKNKKIYFFVLKKMSCLMNKAIFNFYTISKLSWCNHLYTVLTTDVCLLFSYFCSFCILVSKTQGRERVVTLLYQYKWQTFNKMNEKKVLRYQSVGAEYVTEQINSLILQLLLR